MQVFGTSVTSIMNFFMPLVAFNLRFSYLGAVWTVMILCVHEHFHVNLESPFLRWLGFCGAWFGLVAVVGWGLVLVLVFWGFSCREKVFLLLCFQDFRKLKKKFRAFCLVPFGKIFFFQLFCLLKKRWMFTFSDTEHTNISTPPPLSMVLFCFAGWPRISEVWTEIVLFSLLHQTRPSLSVLVYDMVSKVLKHPHCSSQILDFFPRAFYSILLHQWFSMCGFICVLCRGGKRMKNGKRGV